MIQKKFSFFILFICLFCQFHVYAQSKYLIKDKEGLDFILNIDIDGNTINGYTREKALLDYASKLEFKAIKLVSTLKYPEIIRFDANLTNGRFEGTYSYLFSSYKIVGKIDGDSIFYSLFNKNNEMRRSFEGKKIANYIKKDYNKLAKDIIRITEDSIYDPKIIQLEKWNKFKEKFLSATPNTYDDLEFQIGFFALTRKIGFSHYYLVKDVNSINSEKEKPTLKEINNNTVLLTIKDFSDKKENIKPLLDSILQKGYTNLVIDIRDNPGGNFESTFLIGNFLSGKNFVSGFLPNRNWYKEYNRWPNKNDIDKFCLMSNDSIQNNSKYGFYVKTKVSDAHFKGKAYLLINHNTGSAAEALAIGAKENGLATLVGEKTAGQLLKIKPFKIDENFTLIIPFYDFISYQGYRVDQKGIEPDIKTKRGQEMEQS